MIQDTLKDALHRMDQAITHTRMEFGKVRTGRANPELLEGLSLDYYGTMTPFESVIKYYCTRCLLDFCSAL